MKKEYEHSSKKTIDPDALQAVFIKQVAPEVTRCHLLLNSGRLDTYQKLKDEEEEQSPLGQEAVVEEAATQLTAVAARGGSLGSPARNASRDAASPARRQQGKPEGELVHLYRYSQVRRGNVRCVDCNSKFNYSKEDVES